MWKELPVKVRKILKKHVLPGARIYVPKLRSRKNIHRRDELVNVAFRAGASLREIGAGFKISHTRVAQILKKAQDEATLANSGGSGEDGAPIY